MKKLGLIIGMTLLVGACSNEPCVINPEFASKVSGKSVEVFGVPKGSFSQDGKTFYINYGDLHIVESTATTATYSLKKDKTVVTAEFTNVTTAGGTYVQTVNGTNPLSYNFFFSN